MLHRHSPSGAHSTSRCLLPSGSCPAQPDAAIVNVGSGLAFVPLVVHSYTAALREALEGRVEVIELVPPGVQTALTPGQEPHPGSMPLDAFSHEAMPLLQQQPTPPEILVGRVRPLRSADAEGRLVQMVATLYDAARKAGARACRAPARRLQHVRPAPPAVAG